MLLIKISRSKSMCNKYEHEYEHRKQIDKHYGTKNSVLKVPQIGNLGISILKLRNFLRNYSKYKRLNLKLNCYFKLNMMLN